MTNQNKKVYAIIPSAGSGTRFSSNAPKQYFKINNETIIEKTLKHFVRLKEIEKIIIPVSSEDTYILDLEIIKNERIQVISGGATRAESVLEGLKLISSDSLVIVHDVVRPFVSPDMILNLINNFNHEKEDALIYGIPVYEALKKINLETLSVKSSVDRNEFYLAQTPQICLTDFLRDSIESCLKDDFIPGDESEAIERAGGEIRFLPGERSNIKITVSEDIPEERIGNGFDSHRFEEGDGLMIGGFKVPCGLSFAAHSDGDIVLHAIIDSMLGSLGLGDIGVHFPNTEEWKNASGEKLYTLTDEMIKEKGYSIKQVDIIVILEEPKLTPHRDEIIKSIAEITGLSEANIGLKAKTSEKMGFIGKNEGAACLVVTTLNK